MYLFGYIRLSFSYFWTNKWTQAFLYTKEEITWPIKVGQWVWLEDWWWDGTEVKGAKGPQNTIISHLIKRNINVKKGFWWDNLRAFCVDVISKSGRYAYNDAPHPLVRIPLRHKCLCCWISWQQNARYIFELYDPILQNPLLLPFLFYLHWYLMPVMLKLW